MKNNILIIAIVTIAALGVIIAVITASVLNSEAAPPDSGQSSLQSADVPYSSDSETSDAESLDSNVSSDTPSLPASVPDDSSDSSYSEAQGIIATANSLIGVPFAENGSTPDGFDNSGFIYYVLRENGYITCPRGTEAQSRMGSRLEYDEIKVGDLVFFTDDGGSEVSFGGIYIGGGKMIACLMPGTLVREVDISTAYYRGNFFGGVSLT